MKGRSGRSEEEESSGREGERKERIETEVRRAKMSGRERVGKVERDEREKEC